MNDQTPNDELHASSFLQGHNAEYVEQLYARFSADPSDFYHLPRDRVVELGVKVAI